jgi:Ni,Fe-hydrogenase III small subunit/ferredoxin
MIRALLERLRQKHRTVAYPARPPSIPERYRGAPELAPEKCTAGCAACAAACPVGAIDLAAGAIRLDLGKCLFCGDCAAACPPGAIRFTRDPRVAARRRSELVAGTAERRLAAALDGKMKSLFGRSLKLRQVCAGGCGACEADTNVLSTVVFDLGRFGIQFVASPRHADGLLITGPVTENMALALKKTYDALPEPRLVIAVGACAISGGPYAGHAEGRNGADAVVPVDLYIPGCPPHPVAILDGLLRLLGRLDESR